MKTKTKPCKCIPMVNDALRERNAQLVGTIMLRGGTPKVIVATESNGETMRHKFQPVMLAANYCPFCGKKYPESKSATPPKRKAANAKAASAR